MRRPVTRRAAAAPRDERERGGPIGAAPRLAPQPDQRTKVLHDRYAQPIYNYCLRRLRSREEAEDAAQIVFLNAHRCLEEGVEPQSERAWIFKIAEHVVMYRWRTISRRARVEFPVDVGAIADLVVAPEQEAPELEGLPAALARLPDGQRRAIVLREWYGLSYREVAAELGLSVSATETLIFRARCRLAQELGGPAPTVRRRTPLSLASPLASLKWFLGGGTAVKALVGVTSVAVIAVGSAKIGVLPYPAASPSAATPVQRALVLPAVPASRHVVFVRAPVVVRAPARKPRARVVRPAVVAPAAVAPVVAAAPVAVVAPEAPTPAPVSDEASPQVEAAPAAPEAAPAPATDVPAATDDAVVSQPPPADPAVVVPVTDPTIDPAADPAAGTPVVAPPSDPGQSGDVQGPNDNAAFGQSQRSANVPPNAADPGSNSGGPAGPPTDHGNGNDNGNHGDGNNGNGNGNSGAPPAHGHGAADLGTAVAQ